MRDLQKLQINGADEMVVAVRLGSAIGAYQMLKKLEPALSDGTRHGSSECARGLRQLPQFRQQLKFEIAESLGELGIQVTVPKSSIQQTSIAHLDLD